VRSAYSTNMNALLQAGTYIYVLGERLSLAVLVASAACSSNSVTVSCVVSQLVLKTICALSLGIMLGLCIQPFLCLDGALVVARRQQRSGADGGSVGILQRQRREKAASRVL
jgi:hypothetical protein